MLENAGMLLTVGAPVTLGGGVDRRRKAGKSVDKQGPSTMAWYSHNAEAVRVFSAATSIENCTYLVVRGPDHNLV